MKFEKQINKYLEQGIFPGVSILAGQEGKVIYKKSFGYLSLFPNKIKITDDTIYDLASITKPAVTSLLIHYLLDSGYMSLDTGISTFFDGFHKDISIRHLLTHTSGLPAWFPLYLKKSTYLETLKQLDLKSFPGRSVRYSCLGYILLGFIIEKISGDDLDKILKMIFFGKLGMNSSYFKIPSDEIYRTAPTESGNIYEKDLVKSTFPGLDRGFTWRKSIIRGEANDGNAYYLGRPAGNAGLFSTAEDLFRLSGEFFPETAKIIKPESAKLFWKNLTPFRRSHRSSGFKINSSVVSSGGLALKFSSVGHTGFTGTSIWLEKKKMRVYIILSNRIHPKVNSRINFNKIRRKIHRIMKKEIFS